MRSRQAAVLSALAAVLGCVFVVALVTFTGGHPASQRISLLHSQLANAKHEIKNSWQHYRASNSKRVPKNAYYDGWDRVKEDREVGELKKEVQGLKHDLTATAQVDAEQRSQFEDQVKNFDLEMVSSLKKMQQVPAQKKKQNEAQPLEGTRTTCECTTAGCEECPDSDYHVRTRAMYRVHHEQALLPEAKALARAKAALKNKVEKVEAASEKELSKLHKRQAALQHLAGEESEPHYYVKGEYGNKYDEVYNKLFAPGDATPIRASGGLFEDVRAPVPLPGKRMITRIRKIQLSGNITCTNCYFLGQNSKVIINNIHGANVTDSGEDDEDEHSVFDASESLRMRTTSDALMHQQQLRRHQLQHERERHARLEADLARAKKVHEHVLQEEGRDSTIATAAAAAAELVMAAGLKHGREQGGERVEKKGGKQGIEGKMSLSSALSSSTSTVSPLQKTFKESKLQRVEKTNKVLSEAQAAVARSNSILRERLAAEKATSRMFQSILDVKD